MIGGKRLVMQRARDAQNAAGEAIDFLLEDGSYSPQDTLIYALAVESRGVSHTCLEVMERVPFSRVEGNVLDARKGKGLA